MEDGEIVSKIAAFCISQMEISNKKTHDEFHEAIWLICQKIHRFIVTQDETNLVEVD